MNKHYKNDLSEIKQALLDLNKNKKLYGEDNIPNYKNTDLYKQISNEVCEENNAEHIETRDMFERLLDMMRDYLPNSLFQKLEEYTKEKVSKKYNNIKNSYDIVEKFDKKFKSFRVAPDKFLTDYRAVILRRVIVASIATVILCLFKFSVLYSIGVSFGIIIFKYIIDILRYFFYYIKYSELNYLINLQIKSISYETQILNKYKQKCLSLVLKINKDIEEKQKEINKIFAEIIEEIIHELNDECTSLYEKVKEKNKLIENIEQMSDFIKIKEDITQNNIKLKETRSDLKELVPVIRLFPYGNDEGDIQFKTSKYHIEFDDKTFSKSLYISEDVIDKNKPFFKFEHNMNVNVILYKRKDGHVLENEDLTNLLRIIFKSFQMSCSIEILHQYLIESVNNKANAFLKTLVNQEVNSDNQRQNANINAENLKHFNQINFSGYSKSNYSEDVVEYLINYATETQNIISDYTFDSIQQYNKNRKKEITIKHSIVHIVITSKFDFFTDELRDLLLMDDPNVMFIFYVSDEDWNSATEDTNNNLYMFKDFLENDSEATSIYNKKKNLHRLSSKILEKVVNKNA